MSNEPKKKRAKKDCSVGYGKPPAESRFQKGISGNPKGRPKSTLTLNSIFETELQRVVEVGENGKFVRIPKRVACIRRLINKALSGEKFEMKILYEWLSKSLGLALQRDDGNPQFETFRFKTPESREEVERQIAEILKEAEESAEKRGD